MPLTAGTRLGPYEIVAPLGAGGMGEVYRARDTRLGRDVAVKVLPAHLTGDSDARARLEREARSVAALSHANICALYDVGSHEGTDYLVMELLEGETLAARAARGPLPLAELARVGIQIADALDKAHRKGLVHRDLKPGNVMLTRSGAKLLDFGLARATGLGATSSLSHSPTLTRPLTAEGTLVGTFHYMSPEQLEGKEADARSDVWALGATLYEMATGRRPFEGASQASLIAAIMHVEPRAVAELVPATTPALDRLIRACLAKDPEERIQTAHDVKLQLQWLTEGGSQAGAPASAAAPRAPRLGVAWLAAAAFAVATLALAVALVRVSGRGEPVIRASIPAPPGTLLELQSRHPGVPRLSPDGHAVVFAARAPGAEPILWVRPLDGAARALPGTEGAAYPFWSPDGRSIAFFAAGKLRRVDVAGGPPVNVCDAPLGKGGDWGPDGTILFAPGNLDPIHRVAASGGESRAVTRIDTTRGENSHRFPQFLPDGKHFIYFARLNQSADAATGGIMLASLDDGKSRLLLSCESQGVYAAGRLLFMRQRSLMAQRLDPRTLKLEGDALPVVDAVYLITGAGFGAFSAAGEGALIYLPPVQEDVSELVLLDRAGAVVDTFGRGILVGRFELSPNGLTAVGEEVDSRSGLSDLRLYDLSRHTRSHFTFDPFNESSPVWSPDGARIAYASFRSGRWTLYVRPVQGGAPEESLSTPQEGLPTGWSPDGRELIYMVNSPRTREDLWILPLTGDRRAYPFLDAPFNENSGCFSPDGRWVAYMSSEAGQVEACVTAFPSGGRRLQASTEGGFLPRWRADGKELYFQSASQKLMAVSLGSVGSDLQVGPPKVLFDLPDNASFDPNRTGTRFLVNRPVALAAQTPLALVTHWTKLLEHR